MSRPNYPPAYLRYLKARLWNFTRPTFWGTAIFLSLVGLGIKEYWEHPQFLSQLQKNHQATVNQPTDSSLSKEDKAIAADIDTLPVLDNESAQGIPSLANPPKDKTQADASTNILDLLKKQEIATSNPTPNDTSKTNSASAPAENPFLVQTEKSLRFGNVQSSTAGLPQVGSQNSGSPSALQTALNQVDNRNYSNSSGIYANQIATTASNSTGYPLSRSSYNNYSSTQPSGTGYPPVSNYNNYSTTQPSGTGYPPVSNYNNYSSTQPSGTGYPPVSNYNNYSSTQPSGTGYPPVSNYNNYSTTQPSGTGYPPVSNYNNYSTTQPSGTGYSPVSNYNNYSSTQPSGTGYPPVSNYNNYSSTQPSTQVPTTSTQAAPIANPYNYTTPYSSQTTSQTMVTPYGTVNSNYGYAALQQQNQQIRLNNSYGDVNQLKYYLSH